MRQRVGAARDGQTPLTESDGRSMATSGKGTGLAGDTVQAAVDAQHHLIVAYAVTNVGSGRAQRAPMGLRAQTAAGCGTLTVPTDRGYLNGDQVLACEGTGVLPGVPETPTAGNAERGLFTSQDFVDDAGEDHYNVSRRSAPDQGTRPVRSSGRDRPQPDGLPSLRAQAPMHL